MLLTDGKYIIKNKQYYYETKRSANRQCVCVWSYMSQYMIREVLDFNYAWFHTTRRSTTSMPPFTTVNRFGHAAPLIKSAALGTFL